MTKKTLETWAEWKETLLQKFQLKPDRDKVINVLDSYEIKAGIKDSDHLPASDTSQYLLKEIFMAILHDEYSPGSFLQVGSYKHYYEFTKLLAAAKFEIKEGAKWPSATFDTLKAEAQLKPKEADISPIFDGRLPELQAYMREKVTELEKHGHLTADVFDILVNKWLKFAKYPESMVKIGINDFLQVRGLKPFKRGEDKRSGYTDAQRKQIAEQIDLLDNIYITISEMDIYPKGQKKQTVRGIRGRSIIKDMEAGQIDLAGQVRADEWYLRPGTVFANYFFEPYGRQTALLSVKAVKYDPYRHKWEKSLARYLAWIWRIGSGRTREGLLVKTILEAAGEKINKTRPSRTRERLEKALDQLESDDVISAWEYESIKEKDLAGRGWAKKWLEHKIIITAPDEIKQQYKELEQAKNYTKKYKEKNRPDKE